MPPSGFSQKAINGLLEFVRANYELVLERHGKEDLLEKDFLEKASKDLENQAKEILKDNFPNSKDLSKGFEGLATFVAECFRDLAKEIESGKDKYGRPVIEGKAIQKELSQIKDYLTKFTI